ncbi:winged helix-turn-helix transcriptional regulator [Nocardia jiangxiensis]|uniref:Winged helix-turn-helix transcriptional regulator n=1 Tax=Nocardia jiangxiensis TaxID=282685 RepID=A0ABW6S8G1_9NOCA
MDSGTPKCPHGWNYSLTPLGRTLQAPIAMLTEWAQTYGEALVDFQESAAANHRHQVRAAHTL